jgi:hypothetical protein
MDSDSINHHNHDSLASLPAFTVTHLTPAYNMTGSLRQMSWLLVALCAATSLTGTANGAATSSSNCSTPTHFFTQLIEHENSSSKATFQQQYQIVADHFKPGGPILYYQQAETSLFACMVSQ